MRIVLMGAGRMAYGFVHDFLKNDQLEKLTVIDRSDRALEAIKERFKDARLSVVPIKADDSASLRPLFQTADGVASAVPYDYNLELTKLAIQTGCHFVDLGGNNTVVEKQFALDAVAREAGVGVVPDCGLAPGMVSVVTAYAADQLARVDSLKIRVGGLPLHPKTPLNYMLLFSVHGLINEYIEPAVILEDGKQKAVPSMTGVEEIDFPRPFGMLEAFYTSGGTSTLPKTFEGKINYLDYKTIRYPGHCHLMKAMIDLGFCDEKRIKFDGTELSRRDVFERMLSIPLTYEDEDVTLIRITASGQKGGSSASVQYQAIEYGDKEAGLTAMMRTTAFPAAIILQMLIEGIITDRGVLRQELAVPGGLFMRELEKRNIRFEES